MVLVAETVLDEHKLYPFAGELRHHDALMLHRHAISHPAAAKWSDRETAAFVEARRDVKGLPVALVWDLNLSLNELLVEAGGTPHLTSIALPLGSGGQLRTILQASCTAAYQLGSEA